MPQNSLKNGALLVENGGDGHTELPKSLFGEVKNDGCYFNHVEVETHRPEITGSGEPDVIRQNPLELEIRKPTLSTPDGTLQEIESNKIPAVLPFEINDPSWKICAADDEENPSDRSVAAATAGLKNDTDRNIDFETTPKALKSSENLFTNGVLHHSGIISVSACAPTKDQGARALGPDGCTFWRKPLIDQIFITDVTSNYVTVTVKECFTDKGFFRDR